MDKYCDSPDQAFALQFSTMDKAGFIGIVFIMLVTVMMAL